MGYEIKQAQAELPPEASAKTKNSKAAAIVATICAAVAFFGVGFGIFGVIKSNSYSQQVSELEQKLSETSENHETSATSCPDVAEEDSASEKEVVVAADSQDYIYISDFGIKIKEPENGAQNFGGLVHQYTFSYSYPHATNTLEIEGFSDDDLVPIANITTSGTETACDYFAFTPDACFDVENTRVFVKISGGAAEDFRKYFTDPKNYYAM